MFGLILSYPIDFASLTSRHGQAVTDVSHSLALRWFSWRENGTFESVGLGASTVSEQTLPRHTSPFILKGNQNKKTKQKTLRAQSIGMEKPRVLPFCTQRSPSLSVTSWKRPESVAKYQIRHEPTFFYSLLVKSEPTWLRSEEHTSEEKKKKNLLCEYW